MSCLKLHAGSRRWEELNNPPVQRWDELNPPVQLPVTLQNQFGEFLREEPAERRVSRRTHSTLQMKRCCFRSSSFRECTGISCCARAMGRWEDTNIIFRHVILIGESLNTEPFIRPPGNVKFEAVSSRAQDVVVRSWVMCQWLVMLHLCCVVLCCVVLSCVVLSCLCFPLRQLDSPWVISELLKCAFQWMLITLTFNIKSYISVVCIQYC